MARDLDALFLDAPARAAADLSTLPAPLLRGCISQLAAALDQVVLHDHAITIGPAGGYNGELRFPVAQLAWQPAAVAGRDLPLDHTVTYTFGGLANKNDDPYGDWCVDICRSDADARPLPETSRWQEAMETLAAAPPKRLRHLLSDLCEATPRTMYVGGTATLPQGGLTRFDDGTPTTQAGGAAMIFCAALRPHLDAGQTWRRQITTLQHGNQAAMCFDIAVTRHSLGV